MLKQLKNDGSLIVIKWILIGMIIFAFLGGVYGAIKVVYFEQTYSGRYSIHNECVSWDEVCLDNCQENQYDNPRGASSSCNCCIEKKDIIMPLGIRIKEAIKFYAITLSGLGFTAGAVLAGYFEKKFPTKFIKPE